MSGAWRAVATGDGSTTLAHPVHGQLCHDVHGAWSQARRRYAAGCALRLRARRGEVMRLLDVGTGLGWNLAAALSSLRYTGARLQALTLERDPAPLRAAVAFERAGTGAAERCHRAVRVALARALEEPARPHPMVLEGREAGSLELRLGDARANLPELEGRSFDAVFLDPFSPAVEQELWDDGFLAAVAARMAPGALLATYSAATAVRVGLARAGLGVRRAPRVGGKAEGTVAGPGLVAGPEDADLERRIRRRLAHGGVGGVR